MQLELPFCVELKPDDKVAYLENLYECQIEKYERLRKSLHAKNGELKKQVSELQERLFILERHICVNL